MNGVNYLQYLSPTQQQQYSGLDNDDKLEINEKIRSIHEIINIIVDDNLRESVRREFNTTPNNNNTNLLQDVIDNTVDRAKHVIIAEYNSDINLILNHNELPLRQAPGGGTNGILIAKVVELLSTPVGGKHRKTSNKKRSAVRRRRSSNRKSRKMNKRRK